MSDYLHDVFGPQGALAAKFPGYAPRDGQVALARAVDAAIAQTGHLVAEAPTGTGKSLAYAVPAAHQAYQAKLRGLSSPAVLVTANIALQEQLVRKDLPLLAEILPWKFRFALLKGKNNYLCLDKLNNGAYSRTEPEDAEQNAQIVAWSDRTETGDMSELPFQPAPKLWNRFSVIADECTGNACESYGQCHAERAREQAMEADIVVTNYHMYFADLRVREQTGDLAKLLPDHRVAVFDEGHKAVDIARDFYGFKISEGTLRWAAGLTPSATKITLERASQRFFSSLAAIRRSKAYKARIRTIDIVESEEVIEALARTCAAYREILYEMPEYERMSVEQRKQAKRLMSRYNRAYECAGNITNAMALYAAPKSPWRAHPEHPEQNGEKWYWSDPARGGDNTVKSFSQLRTIDTVYFIEDDHGSASLCSRPISVAEQLKKQLFHNKKSVTVTSATLATNSSFSFISGELGVERPQTLLAASPFSWKEQALLVLPQSVPEPNDPNFTALVADYCSQVMELSRGRMLGLFTSYKNLNAAHERALRTKYRVLRQGDMPRTKLINEFRNDVNSVLLGTESFWAGVDVPGESLSCVFMDRLPFLTPEDPVLDAVTERDRNWFSNYSVPKAIIAFKQGFGRLIRTTTDRGVVVVLDKRISTKNYGQQFIASLPPVQQSWNLGDVRRFLDREPLVRSPDAYVPTPVVAPSTTSLFDIR